MAHRERGAGSCEEKRGIIYSLVCDYLIPPTVIQQVFGRERSRRLRTIGRLRSSRILITNPRPYLSSRRLVENTREASTRRLCSTRGSLSLKRACFATSDALLWIVSGAERKRLCRCRSPRWRASYGGGVHSQLKSGVPMDVGTPPFVLNPWHVTDPGTARHVRATCDRSVYATGPVHVSVQLARAC